MSTPPPQDRAPTEEMAGRLRDLERKLEAQRVEIEALRRERGLYELITNHMCDGLSVIDRSFIIRDANDAFVRRYGGDRSRIVGRTCHEVTHGSPVPCAGADHVCPVLEARRTGQISQVEHIHGGETGADAIVEVTAIPVPDAQGRAELVVEVAHDVTDRRRAEKEAAERQRVEGVLATTGAACHHLNQPIQGLLLGIERLRRSLREIGHLEPLADQLQAEVDRIVNITRQLQHVARCVTVPYYDNVAILDLARSLDNDAAPTAARGDSRPPGPPDGSAGGPVGRPPR